MGATGGPLCELQISLGVLLCQHVVVALWWTRAGFPLAVRTFFAGKNALCFSSNELLKIEYLRAVLIDTSADEHQRTIVEILFRIQTSKERSPDKFVVFVSQTGPICTLSFKRHANSEVGLLRGCVYSKVIFLHYLSKVWSQSAGLG